MPTTHETPQLIVFRNGQAKFSDLARRRALSGKSAVLLAAPHSIGGRWLLVPVDHASEGGQPLYDDRGQKKFGAQALATTLFALVPATQKSVHLLLEPAPLGFWLLPSGV